jgi:hypothetical protein
MFRNFYNCLFLFTITAGLLNAQNGWSFEHKVSGEYFEERTLDISVYNNDILTYSFQKKLIPNQSIPNIEVLTNGNLLIIHALEGTLEIFDKTGSRIFHKEFFSLPPYREQIMKYHKNNEGIIIITSEESTNKIFSLNNMGILIYENFIESGLIMGVSSSWDSNLAAYSAVIWINNELTERSFILDTQNNEVIYFEGSFESGSFNENNTIFLGVAKNQLSLFDINNNELSWHEELPKGEIFIDAAFSNNKIYFLKGSPPLLSNGKWIIENSGVFVKDFRGEVKNITEISNVESSSEISSDGEHIKVISGAREIIIK